MHRVVIQVYFMIIFLVILLVLNGQAAQITRK